MIKAGDVLYFENVGIVPELITDGTSSVQLVHSFGYPEVWKMVGFDLDPDYYFNQIGEYGRKEIGKDLWELAGLVESCQSGTYRFTANHDRIVKWMTNFLDMVYEDEDEDWDDEY